jgi:lysophospholipid acyltransferase 7
MVGLAFEVHDSYNRKRRVLKLNETISDNLKKLESDQKLESVNSAELSKIKLEMEFLSLEPRPTFIQMFLYAYCYIGLLTGPYFKYRTYQDWLINRNTNEIDSISFVIKRGRITPIIVIGFLILSKFVSFKVDFKK